MADDISTIYDFVFKLDKRTKSIEQDNDIILKQVESLDNEKTATYRGLDDELEQIKKTHEELKNDLKSISLVLMRLSQEMKQMLKKEDVEKIKSIVDGIPFDEFITKNELK